jgi:hypothetical protein
MFCARSFRQRGLDAGPPTSLAVNADPTVTIS